MSRDPPKTALSLIRCRRDNLGDMNSPLLKCILAFRNKVMALVHRGDAGNRPRLVVEYLVSDMRWDTKPCHTRNASPP